MSAGFVYCWCCLCPLLVLSSVWSCPVGPSTGYITGVIVPATATFPLGTRSTSACSLFRSLFLSYNFFSFCPICFLFARLFRVYVSSMDMLLVLCRCKRYGMVYHSSLVTFNCVLLCTRYVVFLYPNAFCRLFCDRRLDSRKMGSTIV